MSTLFAALGTAGNALDVLERAIGVIQNNVSNASTPGYVTQTLQLNATAFDPAGGLWGGVEAGNVQSARNVYAEQTVWAANQQVGMASQQASNLQSLQSVFDVSGSSGIPGALSALYAAFSAWSSTPSSATNQQQVVAAAQGVTQAFNTAASGIDQIRSQANVQTQSTVTQINQLSSQIATMNGEIRSGSQNDAGLNAQLYNSLEQLSNLVGITARTESDGTVTVLMGGQVPLVIGQTQTEIQAGNAPSGGNPAAPPDQKITTSDGQDVTNEVQQGQLGGLLQFTNSVLPSIAGNGSRQGSLNQLAQGIADRVNGLLTSGQTSSGASGIPLFSYTSGLPTAVAGTLTVNAGITASQLAAVSPGPPSVANGIASQLANLSTPQDPADLVASLSYTDFYSSIAANVGTLASNASTSQTTETQVLTQAQNMRSQVSGVSLNDQATQLLQFQQAYEASAQALSTIHSTVQDLLTVMQQVQ